MLTSTALTETFFIVITRRYSVFVLGSRGATAIKKQINSLPKRMPLKKEAFCVYKNYEAYFSRKYCRYVTKCIQRFNIIILNAHKLFIRDTNIEF